ncbi:maleylpyruvate isomerase family mycothiol-dependent enzyme [Nocardioides dongkuii]|uniref:maleylpyruvate isomerase family mycothiol-dependent enzyme n=1 Tax=Nocardioides dongkuii TaxID=2760089 RepID=UPI0015F9D2F4|nr:maleylpyruvate isomerase family mycothiol-dependent enzyme [Nocardioides dongkuii]
MSNHDRLSGFHANAARFTSVVDAGGTWDGASPCAGWTSRDVLRHVVETQRNFLEQRGAGLGPAPDLDLDPARAWGAHLAAVRRAAEDRDFVETEYDGHFGRTSVAATLADFYGFDMLVHRWDLARGLGQDAGFTDAELDTIETALEGFGDNLYLDGVCAPAVPVPDDAPRERALLARMGRSAG